MRTWVQRVVAPDMPPWLLALLAPALILGIVAMHSLLAQAPTAEHAGMSAVTTVATTTPDHDPSHVMLSAGNMNGTPDEGGHGHEGGMPDCGGLMAMCLALLVAVGAYVAFRRNVLHRVLWHRPPPILVSSGAVRAAFEQLTPLQRTAVIRC